MPDTPKFAYQRDRTPSWVRQQLGLHWVVVGERGGVASTRRTPLRALMDRYPT